MHGQDHPSVRAQYWQLYLGLVALITVSAGMLVVASGGSAREVLIVAGVAALGGAVVAGYVHTLLVGLRTG